MKSTKMTIKFKHVLQATMLDVFFAGIISIIINASGGRFDLALIGYLAVRCIFVCIIFSTCRYFVTFVNKTVIAWSLFFLLAYILSFTLPAILFGGDISPWGLFLNYHSNLRTWIFVYVPSILAYAFLWIVTARTTGKISR